MARYYPGDHDETVVPPLAFNEGRDNADNEVKDTTVVLTRSIEGANFGDTVQVGADRATWLIAKGFASRPEDYAATHPDYEPPTEPEPETEPEP